MFLATVTVETNGVIPNRDIHVATPLARIIAQAFAFAANWTGRIGLEAVKIEFRDNIVLELGTLVAITIETNYDDMHILDVAALKAAITQSIYDSAMFKCRGTHGSIRLELHLGEHDIHAEV